ncbi:MAG TPA: serine hydrolase, partial [Elusimicrobiales bacterium]|nr:serine hydrolase [Elusimicrobiales bacterium]
YRNALVAGLPGGVTVSHKFGEGGVMGGERQLQDCGIVYYPGRPYLLCVMAKGTKLENLEKFIKAVSRLVYYSVDTSVRKK